MALALLGRSDSSLKGLDVAGVGGIFQGIGSAVAGIFGWMGAKEQTAQAKLASNVAYQQAGLTEKQMMLDQAFRLELVALGKQVLIFGGLGVAGLVLINKL